jgi:hypothetical protein
VSPGYQVKNRTLALPRGWRDSPTLLAKLQLTDHFKNGAVEGFLMLLVYLVTRQAAEMAGLK